MLRGGYPLAIFDTLFIVAMPYVIESFEPTARKYYELAIKMKDAAKVQPKVEALFGRRRVKFELRDLDPDKGTAAQWNPEKKKA